MFYDAHKNKYYVATKIKWKSNQNLIKLPYYKCGFHPWLNVYVYGWNKESFELTRAEFNRNACHLFCLFLYKYLTRTIH
jgi:hypothetical protein